MSDAPQVPMSDVHPRAYRFADAELDVGERVLRRGDTEAYLTPRIHATLLAFLRRPGELIEKDRLIEAIWPGGVVTDNALTRCIKELRSALGDDPASPRFIETVPRVGYRFLPQVEAAGETDGAGAGEAGAGQVDDEAMPEGAVDAAARPARTRRVFGPEMLWAAGTVVLVMVAAWFLGGRDPAPAPANTVAVLPFANFSADPDAEYFADGVTEEILDALAAVGELRVVARTSAFSFKGQESDIRDIARALGVRHVVEGSVRRSGRMLRVTAKLVEAETGYQRWTETFDGAVTEVFAFQEAIAAGVADALGELIGAGALGGKISAMAGTSDMEVYDTYLLARQIWRQRDVGPIRRSIELLEEVVARDPGYAAGWSALAAANLTLVGYAGDAGGAWTRSREAAVRALGLDEAQAEAHAVLATHAYAAYDWLGAEASFRRARELEPSNATVRLWHAEMLAKLGRVEDALAAMGVALELDPMYTPALGNAAHQLATAGRLDEAAALFQRTWDLGLEAMFVWFGAFYVAVMQERWGDAEAWLGRRPAPAGAAPDRALLRAMREPTEAHRRALVDVTEAEDLRGNRLRAGILYLVAGGAVDAAYERLFDAAAQQWTATESLWHPWLAPLRADPRFDALVREMGMVDYWRSHGPPRGCTLEEDRLACAQ